MSSVCLFHLLLFQNVQEPKELKPLGNYFTVVIFSSPLNDTPQHHKLLVENINWSSSTKRSNENGSKIIDSIYKIYSKLNNNKSTKYLRIICINATKGDLPGEKAKDILKYLKSSVNKSVKKSPIDVIISPKFSLQSGENALDIMESLWYLREHTVLISCSSLHSTLPSTEIIAVRGEILTPKTQDSVQDFVVTYGSNDAPTHTKKQALEKCDKEQPGKSDKELPGKSDKLNKETEESVKELAPAVVCGIALNILDCLQRNDFKTSGNHFK